MSFRSASRLVGKPLIHCRLRLSVVGSRPHSTTTDHDLPRFKIEPLERRRSLLIRISRFKLCDFYNHLAGVLKRIRLQNSSNRRICHGRFSNRTYLLIEELNPRRSATSANSRKTRQGFASELERIDTPEEVSADHERLQTFLDRAVEILTEVKRLGEAGDYRGASGELQKLEPSFCNTRASFENGDFKDAVGIFFNGNPRTCGGAPF